MLAPSLYAFAVMAYLLAVVCLTVSQFARNARWARFAAFASLGLALAGGVAWSAHVYLRGYIFSPGEMLTARRSTGEAGTASFFAGAKRSGDGTIVMLGRGGGKEPDWSEEEDGDAGGALKRGAGVTGSVNALVSDGIVSVVEYLLPAGSRGRSRLERGQDYEGDVKRDCFGCPEMFIVAGGTSMIGAAASDTTATASERPQRIVRIWPQFALSREPIKAGEFDMFRAENDLPPRVCAGSAPQERRYAVCLTAADAEAYAAWLTKRTGRPYRLPTAVEWEFALRTKGTTVLAAAQVPQAGSAAAPLEGMGRLLSEATADCFDPYIPSTGRERLAWQTPPLLCEERVLKGAALTEPHHFMRASARRPWRHNEPRWTVGFRVMRPGW